MYRNPYVEFLLYITAVAMAASFMVLMMAAGLGWGILLTWFGVPFPYKTAPLLLIGCVLIPWNSIRVPLMAVPAMVYLLPYLTGLEHAALKGMLGF